MPPEQQGEGAGGEHLANYHAQHNKAHRLLGGAGKKGDEQPQYRPCPDKLFGGLHRGGGTHPANAVKTVLVEVFHPGEQHAGNQQRHPQPGAGVPQQIDRDGVGQQNHSCPQGEDHQKKAPERTAQHQAHCAIVPQGMVPGGQGGHRHRQSHGREGHEHGIHRHYQLIQPHGLRADEPGQGHAVQKSHHLREQAGGGEQQGTGQNRGQNARPPSQDSFSSIL